MKSGISILQVSPTGYSKNSVIGGGEKYVLYADHALRRAIPPSLKSMLKKLLGRS